VDAVLWADRLDLYRVEPLDRSMAGAAGDALGRGLWGRAVLGLTHANLGQPPPGTTFESFAARRAALVRGSIRRPFFRPALPAALIENAEGCRLDAGRRRLLPDGTPWLPALVGALVDAALAAGPEPYVFRPAYARNPNDALKWLIPLVAAGQALLWRRFLLPELSRDERAVAEEGERVWRVKARRRRDLGIGPPLRPTPENAWRLEQMYDDD
jgi:hypothetical protein